MQMRLGSIIDKTNELIKNMIGEGWKEWKVDASDGSVVFGSALYNWAISTPSMRKTGIGFNEIYDYCQRREMDELAERCKLYEVVLDMVIKHLPNPLVAQKKRIKRIWKGEGEIGECMETCDPEGPVAFMITNITIDPHAGEVATGRLFSGTITGGQTLHISDIDRTNRVQQVGVFMGPDRLEVDRVPAGNIVAVTGLKDAIAGSTVSSVEILPFESIKHASEPVVTVAVEAKTTKDLPKLIEVLRQMSKEDPTIKVEINEETGEHLISGMGELHLEIITYRIEHDKNVPIETSKPIVVYREAIQTTAGPVEGKSPNRHNRFYFEVEPMSKEVVDLIKSERVSMHLPELDRRNRLMDAGMPKEEARKVVDIFESNMLIDTTKGIQYLSETMELIIDGFEEVMAQGPLAREKCQGIIVKLTDVKLHEDSIHRGPAQVIPAVRHAINAAILMADATFFEPLQYVFIHVPQAQMGNATKEIQGRRGQILDVSAEGGLSIIKSKSPVAEMFGFAANLRSATEGRALWSTEHAGFENLPRNLREEIIMQVRKRKGLKLEMPRPSDHVS
jgi:elongation factor 2